MGLAATLAVTLSGTLAATPAFASDPSEVTPRSSASGPGGVAATDAGGGVRITEWMYSGEGGEFVELTNVGSAAVDLTGWVYDDDSADSADPAVGFDLSPFGVVEAGESVVLVESDAAAFRGVWGLCEGTNVLGGYTNNLGRADQVNVFDAAGELVDRLTYGDNTVGGPRTQDASGWVSAEGLGADDATAWTRSSVGDAEGSWAGVGGAIGSPGRSTRATVAYDPCDGETPTVIAPQRPVVVGAVGATGNPRLALDLTAPDGVDPADITVTATATSGAILPAGSITIDGNGAERTVSFAPGARGVTTVTFAATWPAGGPSTASVTYAASAAIMSPAGSYIHGVSDASSVLDVGAGHALVVDDESNTVHLYGLADTTAPVKAWSFTSAQLGTSSEIDLEGMARSGDTVVMVGSHGNNRSGSVREERRTMFAVTIAGEGATTELTFSGRYSTLWQQLVAWDAADGHGLGSDALGFTAATAPGVEPNPPGGFNVEGFEFGPDGTTGYLGFRAPTIERDGEPMALVVPITNVLDLVAATPGTAPAQMGEPILLDLDGRSIREIRRNDQGDYLISAGPSPANPGWALYAWDGDPASAPEHALDLPGDDPLTAGSWESILRVPHPLTVGAETVLVADTGDANLYGTGANKDLAVDYRKSYVQPFTLTGPEPVVVVDPDEELVRRAYRVVLGREVDAASLTHWSAQVRGGVAPIAITEALARSTEGRRRLVDQSYRTVLGRGAETAGRDYWAERLKTGLSPERLMSDLAASREVYLTAGSSPEGMAELLYRIHLGRPSDAAGRAYWTGWLARHEAPSHRASASMTMGRTAEASAVALRSAVIRACGPDAARPANSAPYVERYASSGRDLVRLWGAVLALHCPAD